MENIILYVEEYEGAKTLVKGGITFTDAKIIKLLIDGEDVSERKDFEDSLIYFDELEKSTEKSGNYLIFTSICGVADDGGWEGILVTISEDTIRWTFEIGESTLNFSFSKEEYIGEIASLKKQLKNNELLVLEPSPVVFPENFRR